MKGIDFKYTLGWIFTNEQNSCNPHPNEDEDVKLSHCPRKFFMLLSSESSSNLHMGNHSCDFYHHGFSFFLLLHIM